MATTKEAKVKFSADTSEFTAGIKQANSSLTQLRSELKLNKAQADSAGDSIDNLSDRQRILAQEYEASQSKIDALTNKLEAAKSAFGESSTEVQKLETQLNNARTAQTRIQQEIDATAQALDDLESSSQQAGSALGKMESDLRSQESELQRLKTAYNQVAAEQGETSDEARRLAQQIQTASKQVSDSRDSFNQARTAADKFDATLDKVGDTARDTGGDLDVMDIALGDFISDAAQNALGALGDLEESTRQYRNEQSKLETVAQTSGQSLDVLKNGYADLYAITGDETLASTAVLNMSAMGVSAKDQSVLVNAAAGAWAAYGDSIPLDGLLESINETSRAGQVTGSFADALNWANMSQEQWGAALAGNSKAQAAFNKGIADGMSVEDAFNEALKTCTTTQERQKLVTDAMDAAYGKLGSTYQTTNADVIAANDASRNLADAQAALGEAVAPLTTYFTNLTAGGLTWLVTNLPILVPLVAGLGAGFAAWLVITTLVPAITGVVTGLGGLAGVLAIITSPITLVVVAIAALTAGFIALWNSSETFRNGVMTIWTTIQTVFGTLAEWFMTTVVTPVVTYFQSLWPTVSSIFTQIQSLISTVMGAISGFISSNMGTIQAVWNAVWGVVSSVTSTVWGVIQAVISGALGVIQGIITTVTGVISGDWDAVFSGISQITSSIFNTIRSVISSVLSGISGIVSSVLGTVGGTFDSIFGGIGDTVSSVINTAKSVVSNGLNAISGFFSGLHISFPKIKLPHFSISGSFSLMPPSVPSIGISWYAKGGILEAPTIFGASGSSLLGGGEAGKEAVAPLSDLLGYMMTALDRKFDSSGMDGLIDAIEDLADRVISVEIDGRQVARATASDADRVNGTRQQLVRRGVSLA